jgi:hypothetical protein
MKLKGVCLDFEPNLLKELNFLKVFKLSARSLDLG